MDPFWQCIGCPTAEEWQALWAFFGVAVAGILLAVAVAQLRGLSEANQLLAASNLGLAESNAALVRPYVVVQFGTSRSMRRDPRVDEGRTATLVVYNNGQTTALGVRVSMSPPLETTLTIVPAKKAAEVLRDNVREVFSGRSMGTISPKQSVVYPIDKLEGFLNDATLPDHYDLKVMYSDLSGREWIESYSLSMVSRGPSLADPDRLQRISKDIQHLRDAVVSGTAQVKRAADGISDASKSSDPPGRRATQGLLRSRAPRIR